MTEREKEGRTVITIDVSGGRTVKLTEKGRGFLKKVSQQIRVDTRGTAGVPKKFDLMVFPLFSASPIFASLLLFPHTYLVLCTIFPKPDLVLELKSSTNKIICELGIGEATSHAQRNHDLVSRPYIERDPGFYSG